MIDIETGSFLQRISFLMEKKSLFDRIDLKRLPFVLTPIPNKGVIRGIDTLVRIKDRRVSFLRTLGTGEFVYTLLEGYGKSAADYTIRIENHKTGAALRISGDRPIAKWMFWANPAVYCAEPYIHIRVAPGESFSWNIHYDLYTCITP